MMSTKIPVSLKELIVCFFERTIVAHTNQRIVHAFIILKNNGICRKQGDFMI